MIIDQEINPKRDLYYYGGLLLKILLESNAKEISFTETHIEMNKKVKISSKSFAFTIDWLYLLGALDLKGGRIIKCL